MPGNGSDPIGFDGLDPDPEVGAQLGDEPDQEAPADDEPPPVLPGTFDLFGIKPGNLRKLRDQQIDPVVRKVRVYSSINGKRGPCCGTFMPEAMSIRWFNSRFPPGIYDMQACNAENVYVGGGRHVVPERSGGGSVGGEGLSPILEDVLRALVDRGLRNQGDAEGNSVAKMMQAQANLMTQAVSLQMQMMTAQREPAREESSQLLKLFELMQTQQTNTLNLLLNRKETQASRTQPGKFTDFVGAMQMGLELSAMINRGEDDRAKWEQMIPKLVDSIGPGLIAVVAQAFPQEKSKMVIDLIESHMKARQAEAEADAGTVDTEGEPVDS